MCGSRKESAGERSTDRRFAEPVGAASLDSL
jgi:hypothetical protein